MAKINFTSDYQLRFGYPWTPLPTDAEAANMTTENIQKYMEIWNGINEGGKKSPVASGWTLPSWEVVFDNWHKYSIFVMLGGNACVRADTLIEDPVLGISRRIDEIDGPHHVWAWNGRERVIAEASRPFTKPSGPMLEFRLSNGRSFVAALEHRVLCGDGLWRCVGALKLGASIFQPPTISDSALSNQPQGARRSFGTPQGFQGGYHPSRRFCDEQPQCPEGIGQGVFPSPSDAREHNNVFQKTYRSILRAASYFSQRMKDDRGNKCSRSHACRDLPHQANFSTALHCEDQFVDILSRASCTPCKSVSLSHEGLGFSQAHQLFPDASNRRQSTCEFFQQGNQSRCALAYVTEIRESGNHVKWDMSVPAYENYIVDNVVHHNSGKSFFGARSVLSLAAMIPEASIACFSPSSETSVADQQRLVYEALPDTLKNMPTSKGKHWNLSYSQKNGFTDNVLILPPLPGYRNGSTIRFYSYSQYFQNDMFIEGKRFHAAWLDEECPLGLLDTIRLGRIGAYHGKLLLTWTVVNSWNPTIEKIMARTRVLKKRFSNHPKINHELPVLRESLSMADTLIVSAWSEDNYFVDYSQFLKLNSAESKEVILMRGFGEPTRLATSAFPLFNREINVIPHDQLPWLKPPKKNARGQEIPYRVTRYHAVDPGGSKSWFMLWAAVDASGTWFFYREYPDIALGEWALPGDKAGPAQKGTGISVEKYAETIRQHEDGEYIMERYIDPRMGNNERGGTTIVSELDECDMVMTSATVASSDTNKSEIEDGIQVINDLLHWNPDAEKSFTNTPKLYISDRCENLIYAFSEFTGKLGPLEATKDPIDCVRYLIKSNVGFVDTSEKDTSRTGVY